MGRSGPILLSAIALLAACGARTRLLLPDESASGGTAGGAASSGGGASGGEGTTPQDACSAPLLQGAPTPMAGYCPTRANQASLAAPRAPRIAWTARPFPILDAEAFLPPDVVVDPTGHVFVAFGASPLAPGGLNQVVALDAEGNVSWTKPFDQPVGGLALAADGTLWALEQPPPPEPDAGSGASAILHGLARDGTETATFVVPPQVAPSIDPFAIVPYDSLAIGSDGSFFLDGSSANQGGGSLARVSTSGVTLWQQDPGATVDFSVPVIVTPDDRVIATASQGGLDAFDAQGNSLWQGGTSIVAAADAHGSILTLADDDALSLVTIDAAGVPVRAVPLGSSLVTIQACHLAVASDGTAYVMLVEEAPSPGVTNAHVTLFAIDRTGATRWTSTLDSPIPFDPAAPSAHEGLFVDAEGTLVLTVGAITGIDASTGATLWTVDRPAAGSCLRPAVLAAGRSVLGVQCDGTVFLASDPG